MEPFFFVGYSLGGGGVSGRVRALNLTVPLGSGQTISGTGRVRASVLSPCRPLVPRNRMVKARGENIPLFGKPF